jgi:hypothetical protein
MLYLAVAQMQQSNGSGQMKYNKKRHHCVTYLPGFVGRHATILLRASLRLHVLRYGDSFGNYDNDWECEKNNRCAEVVR